MGTRQDRCGSGLALAASVGMVAIGCAVCDGASEPPTSKVGVPAEARVGYRLEAGPWEVGAIQRLVLHDAARNKDLEVTVRYPKPRKNEDAKSAGTFPMVVFSHGLGGAGPSTFPELTEHWASYGYVVVLPTHSDSIRLRVGQGKEVVDPRKDGPGALATVDLVDRVEDVRFIVDSIGVIEASVPEWRAAEKAAKDSEPKPTLLATVDRERLAVAGHSAGAFTAQLAIGVEARGQRVTGKRGLALSGVGDDRLKAALVISGQGTTSRSLTTNSWKALKKPILVVTGSKDTAAVGQETPESRRHPYELSRSREQGGAGAYLLWIEGATHGSYQGKGLTDLLGEKIQTPIKTITDATASATLAFLDAWVKGDAAAKNELESEAVKNVDREKIRWEWK